jgi:hypothetical protein
LNELRKALRVEPGRIMIRDKGVDSVRANHVANVPFPGEDNTAKFNDFVEVVKEEFEEMHGKHRFIELSEEEVSSIPEVKRSMEQLTVALLFNAKLISRAGIGSLDKRQNSQRDWFSMKMSVLYCSEVF